MKTGTDAARMHPAAITISAIQIIRGMLTGALAAFQARSEATSLAARASFTATGQGGLYGAALLIRGLPEEASCAFGEVADHLDRMVASKTTDVRPVGLVIRRFLEIEDEETDRALAELSAAGLISGKGGKT